MGQQLTDQFRHFDADGDDRIDYDEFRALLTRLGLRRPNVVMRRLFESIDSDGNGFINRREFTAWWLSTE